MTLRVLFISHYPGLGGANFSMIGLIDNLKNMGVEAHVLLPSKGPIESKLKDKGIDYSILKYASLRTKDYGNLLNYPVYLVRSIINHISAILFTIKYRNKFDIIHSNSSLVFFGNTLKRHLGIPLVWHLREFGKEDYGLEFPGGVKNANKNYRNADKLIAISRSIKDYYTKNICKEGKYEIIYNGVEDKDYKSNHSKKTDSGAVKICIVGGISESKNQVDLIRALCMIEPSLFELYVIGDGLEKDVEYLKSQISTTHVQRIHFMGQRGDVADLLKTFDIGVITSKNEAFGRVIIEYMLSGLAVIASNTGACPELIEDGQDGMLYQLGNPNDLYEKLMELIQNQNHRSLLQKNGNIKAKNLFTARKNAEKIKDVYLKLLNCVK